MSELSGLFAAAAGEDDPVLRGRNAALFAVMSQAGLRVHEAVGLDVAQVDLHQESLSTQVLRAHRTNAKRRRFCPCECPFKATGCVVQPYGTAQGKRALRSW
jgi:site-specific recombinase XerD